MYRVKTECRACGRHDLELVMDLGKQPLANAFYTLEDEQRGFAPLEVLFCKQCTLAQLSVVVNPQILYSNYAYVTSKSDTMRRHFERLTKDIISENGLGSMLEIGSNDGTFMKFALEKGMFASYGIDPAYNLADDSTCTGLFDAETAAIAKERLKKVDLIMARHCFAHIDNWREFITNLDLLSHSKTLVAIEVPYVMDLLNRCEWSTLYHEHLSYVGLKPIMTLLKHSQWHIHGVNRYGIHGGAVLIMLRRNDSGIERHLSADEMLAEENVTLKDWERFSDRAQVNIAKIRGFVQERVAKKKIVCAFGASAKATVMINACGFTKEYIQFVTDNSPLKPGKLVPGTNIPVIEEDQFLSEHPDFALLGAWNFAREICEKNQKWLSRGGTFILPNDRLELIHGSLEKETA